MKKERTLWYGNLGKITFSNLYIHLQQYPYCILFMSFSIMQYMHALGSWKNVFYILTISTITLFSLCIIFLKMAWILTAEFSIKKKLKYRFNALYFHLADFMIYYYIYLLKTWKESNIGKWMITIVKTQLAFGLYQFGFRSLILHQSIGQYSNRTNDASPR